MLLRYALLALLGDRELHGYAIKAAFEKRVGPFWVLNFGQIYQGLKHLKGRGLIAARFDPGNGHLGRWVYTITPKGRNALSTWLKRSPRPPQAIRDEMFVRLEEVHTQVAKQQCVYREHIVQLTSSARRDEDFLRVLVRDAEVFHAKLTCDGWNIVEPCLETHKDSPPRDTNYCSRSPSSSDATERRLWLEGPWTR